MGATGTMTVGTMTVAEIKAQMDALKKQMAELKAVEKEQSQAERAAKAEAERAEREAARAGLKAALDAATAKLTMDRSEMKAAYATAVDASYERVDMAIDMATDALRAALESERAALAARSAYRAAGGYDRGNAGTGTRIVENKDVLKYDPDGNLVHILRNERYAVLAAENATFAGLPARDVVHGLAPSKKVLIDRESAEEMFGWLNEVECKIARDPRAILKNRVARFLNGEEPGKVVRFDGSGT